MSFPGHEPPAGAPRTDRLRLTDMRTRAQSSRPLIEPILIVLIGLALGLVNQTSSEVSGVLRVPALVAALILVGQGLSLFDQARQAETAAAAADVPDRVPAGAPAGAGGAPAPAPAPSTVNRGVDPKAAEDAGGPGTMAWLVLALAVWLGLAAMAYPTAPLQLILLAMLAAYLLFARGWRLMAGGSRQ